MTTNFDTTEWTEVELNKGFDLEIKYVVNKKKKKLMEV